MAEAFRNLASIAGLSDPKKARVYYAEAAALDKNHVEGMLWNGWFQAGAGSLNEAETAYRRVISTAKAGQDDMALYWARLGIGNIRTDRGDLAAAMVECRAASEMAHRLAEADPDNAGWQHNLSASYSSVGDVLVAQGNLTEALKFFQDSLAIADRLAKADPNNAEWQRDLSVSYNKVGEVLLTQGNRAEALKFLQDSLAIADRLAKADPNNAEWQRDLSVSYIKVGDVLMAQGNLAEALKFRREVSPSLTTWPRATPTIPAGSAISPSPTRGSATC